MLEAKIHKEITEYEGKIFFGMSGKQIISIMVALAIVIPLFFLLQSHVGVEITGYICILSAAPPLAFGFFKYKGRSFTEIIKLVIGFYFTKQKKLCVNICNTDYIIKNEVIKNNGKKHKQKYKKNECTELYTSTTTRKQHKKRRAEIRNNLTAFKKELVLQQKK